jgi:hypothetical protein
LGGGGKARVSSYRQGLQQEQGSEQRQQDEHAPMNEAGGQQQGGAGSSSRRRNSTCTGSAVAHGVQSPNAKSSCT